MRCARCGWGGGTSWHAVALCRRAALPGAVCLCGCRDRSQLTVRGRLTQLLGRVTAVCSRVRRS